MIASKRRALIVLPTATMGGAERVMSNLAGALLRSGFEVTVYAMSRGHKPGWEQLAQDPNFRLIARPFPSEKTSLVSFAMSIYALSRPREFDFVFSSHTHVNAALSFMRRMRWLRCNRLVARESTLIFERFRGLRRVLLWVHYRFLYGLQDLLVVQTERMKQSLIEHLGFSPVRAVAVIANPVNLHSIGAQKVAEVACPDGRLIIGCGRLIPIKGFDTLLRAFALVRERHNDTRLVILGDGPERHRLAQEARKLGVAEHVTWPGRIDNPYSWFARAEVGIIPSIKEGFPNVLIEMMASGTRHVISTPCSDGVDSLPGITIIPSRDASAMAQAILVALESGRDDSGRYLEYITQARTAESFWHQIEAAVQ